MNELNLIVYHHESLNGFNIVKAKSNYFLTDEEVIQAVSENLNIDGLAMSNTKVYRATNNCNCLKIEWDESDVSYENLENLMEEYAKYQKK